MGQAAQQAPAAAMTCPECETVVPKRAKFCPSCALSFSPAAQARREGVQTIEKTGKGLKAQVALATVLVVLGLVVAGVGVKVGLFPVTVAGLGCVLFGVLWRWSARISIWWNHG